MTYVRITGRTEDGSYTFEELRYDGHGSWKVATIEEANGQSIPIGAVVVRHGDKFDGGTKTDNVRIAAE